MRNRGCSLWFIELEASGTSLCAADRKITGNAVAYFRALNNGFEDLV
jgi:hypothetical protein